jgi:hypothetical protein
MDIICCQRHALSSIVVGNTTRIDAASHKGSAFSKLRMAIDKSTLLKIKKSRMAATERRSNHLRPLLLFASDLL